VFTSQRSDFSSGPKSGSNSSSGSAGKQASGSHRPTSTGSSACQSCLGAVHKGRTCAPGSQVCFPFNAVGGCATPCSAGRRHVCSKCAASDHAASSASCPKR
jgi:hypothetical protein